MFCRAVFSIAGFDITMIAAQNHFKFAHKPTLNKEGRGMGRSKNVVEYEVARIAQLELMIFFQFYFQFLILPIT